MILLFIYVVCKVSSRKRRKSGNIPTHKNIDNGEYKPTTWKDSYREDLNDERWKMKMEKILKRDEICETTYIDRKNVSIKVFEKELEIKELKMELREIKNARNRKITILAKMKESMQKESDDISFKGRRLDKFLENVTFEFSSFRYFKKNHSTT